MNDFELAVERRTVLEKPRLGFLGVGWIGLHRMEAIERSGLADIVAIADTAQERIDAALQAAPGAAPAGSLEEVLDIGVDGVVIATPSALHAEQAIATLERGVAVFCQKPLARTAGETQQVVEVARAADRPLGVDLSYRYVAGVTRMRELIRSGELGDIFAANLVFHNAYGPDKAWFYDPRLSGGGCVIDLGIHLVDLALWLLDYPSVDRVASDLFAGGKPLGAREDMVEDYAAAQIGLSTGAAVQLTCSWKVSAGQDAVIEASFYGTGGGVSLRNVNGSFYDFMVERYSGTAREVIGAPPDEWGGRAAVRWAEQLAGGGKYDSAIEHIVEVARLLDRIYGR
jgi:predicted dehydrogenase